MSIKPCFCDSIFKGLKLYEYRKKVFSRTDVDKAYIYASKPISKIVGYFTIGNIIEDTPSMVWDMTHKQGGITKKQFNDYFKGCKNAHAIEIKDLKRFNEPIDPKQVVKDFTAPQNYRYLDFDL